MTRVSLPLCLLVIFSIGLVSGEFTEKSEFLGCSWDHGAQYIEGLTNNVYEDFAPDEDYCRDICRNIILKNERKPCLMGTGTPENYTKVDQCSGCPSGSCGCAMTASGIRFVPSSRSQFVEGGTSYWEYDPILPGLTGYPGGRCTCRKRPEKSCLLLNVSCGYCRVCEKD
jgi:hypothetical protein